MTKIEVAHIEYGDEDISNFRLPLNKDKCTVSVLAGEDVHCRAWFHSDHIKATEDVVKYINGELAAMVFDAVKNEPYKVDSYDEPDAVTFKQFCGVVLVEITDEHLRAKYQLLGIDTSMMLIYSYEEEVRGSNIVVQPNFTCCTVEEKLLDNYGQRLAAIN